MTAARHTPVVRRPVLLSATMIACLGLLFWARLIIINNPPRHAIAEPERDPAPSDATSVTTAPSETSGQGPGNASKPANWVNAPD